MGNVDWRDAAIRAVKTFVQAAVPMLAAVPALVAEGDVAAIPALAVSAGLAGAAAVIALVWNVLLDWSRD